MSQRKRKGSTNSSKCGLLTGQSTRTRGQMSPATGGTNDDDEEEGCRQGAAGWKRTLPEEDEMERRLEMGERTRTIRSRSQQQHKVGGIFARSVPHQTRIQQQAYRSQPLAASLVFIFLSSHLTLLSAAVQLAQEANGSQSHSLATSGHLGRLQVSLVPAPQNATTTTPSRRPPTGVSALKLEDEVDLLRPARLPARANPSGRKPRIYKVRADSLNGRLSLPLRLNINDRLLSIPVDRQLAAAPLEFQVNRTIASATTTRLPATAAATSSGHSAARSGEQFGARGPLSQQQADQRQPMLAKQASSHSSDNRTAKDCKPPDGRDQGSISMSSQTLRLVPVALGTVGRATPTSKAGPSTARPAALEDALRPQQQQQRGRHREVAAASVAAFKASSNSGEVEESESAVTTSARHANQQQRRLGELQPAISRAAGSASSLSSSGQSVGAKRNDDDDGLHRVVSGVRVVGDELSFVGPPATSGGELGASVESPPRSPGADSILSLIDEYDSKIITNRTKAQLSCDSGEMILRLNFSEPYKGIVYPDHDRLSPCRFFGDGHHNYELRLPLRGCGTRQAAPRVFVNDVIVRFHKTLELEEDEVKTLICRYPPPLASSTPPLEQGGTGVNISLAGDRPATSGGGNRVELESPSQFEFIEPTSGQPTRPEPGSSGNIEALSENLIVAPAGGIKLSGSPGGGGRANSPFLTPPYAGGRPPAGTGVGVDDNQLQRLPADLFNQRNSIVAEPPSTVGHDSANGPNFLERLSSVELLLLISSLMFLILLAIGLASGYLCFRRARRTRHGQRASAILKSGKQRYLGPGAISQMVTTTAASPVRRSAQRPSSFSHDHPRQPHHYRVAPAQFQQHYHRCSSPDSDLSARGLLASDSRLASHQQPPSSYVYRNAAYVPDQPQAGYNLRPSAAATGVGVCSAVPFALAPSGKATNGRKQPAGLVKPVLGRRDTVYGYSDFGQAPMGRAGLQQHQLNGGQYAMVSKPPKQALAPEMWRAKSLSSVQEPQPLQPGGHQMSSNWRLPSAQLAAREEQARRRHSQRHRYYRGDNLEESKELERDEDEQFGASRDQRLRHEAVPNHHQVSGVRILPLKFAAAPATAGQKPSTILLKSIEDSYITNYTEIEEQEHIKSNSTRRISVEQWRAMQPGGGGGSQAAGQRGPPPPSGPSGGGGGGNGQQRLGSARLIRSSSSDSDASDLGNSNSLEAASDQQRSTATNHQANLRSLTELDVNFAKSLLMPVSQLRTPSAGRETSPSAAGGAALSDGGGGGNDNAGSPRGSMRNERSRSVTELAAAATMQKSSTKTRDEEEGGATSGPRRATRRQLQSPDLILSPEYDLDRLALESPLSSHNSVSYV